MYTPPIVQGDPTGNLCLNYLGDSGIADSGRRLALLQLLVYRSGDVEFRHCRKYDYWVDKLVPIQRHGFRVY